MRIPFKRAWPSERVKSSMILSNTVVSKGMGPFSVVNRRFVSIPKVSSVGLNSLDVLLRMRQGCRVADVEMQLQLDFNRRLPVPLRAGIHRAESLAITAAFNAMVVRSKL